MANDKKNVAKKKDDKRNDKVAKYDDLDFN